jgi:predicted ABC-type ATPase
LVPSYQLYQESITRFAQKDLLVQTSKLTESSFNKELRLHHAQFNYQAQSNVGIDVDCTIKKGEITVIVGSSGSGKTETAKSLINDLKSTNIIRIDADDIKEWLVKKLGGDINDYHRSAVIGVEKLCDYCLEKKRDFIIDGTFVDKEKSIQNIKRALDSKRNYTVIIVYVYQSSYLAWEFIQKRAKKTGRDVPHEVFKKTFIESLKNVIDVKEKFGSKVVIHSIEKNFDYSEEEYRMNVGSKDLKSLLQKVTIEHSKI